MQALFSRILAIHRDLPINLFDIRAIARRPRGKRTLFERARKYIGSVKGPLDPRKVAAKAKALVCGIIAEKHSR